MGVVEILVGNFLEKEQLFRKLRAPCGQGYSLMFKRCAQKSFPRDSAPEPYHSFFIAGGTLTLDLTIDYTFLFPLVTPRGHTLFHYLLPSYTLFCPSHKCSPSYTTVYVFMYMMELPALARKGFPLSIPLLVAFLLSVPT